MKFRKINLNTITKKTVAGIVCIGLILILIINLIYPYVFYKALGSYITDSLSGVIDAVSVRYSYILSFNNSLSRYALQDQELIQLLSSYYDNPELSEQIENDLDNYFETRQIGTPDNPSEVNTISSTAYSMLTTEKGDVFCKDSIKDLADAIIESEWYINALKDPEFFCYSPVFTNNRGAEIFEYFCYVLPFDVNGMTCYSIVIVDFKDFKTQLYKISQLGIDDYAIVGNDGLMIYQNLNTDESKINLHEYPKDMLEGVQYEVKTYQHDDGIDFAVLFSYSSEGMRLVIHASDDVLMKPYSRILLFYIISTWVILFVFTIFICIMLKKVLKRLVKLTKKMDRVIYMDYNVSLCDDSDDEIGRLSRTFNLMMSKIRSNIHEIVKRQKREKEIMYRLVVSEIDPHFLYNTLNTINYLAEDNRSKEIILVNNALIALLKDRLKVKHAQSFDFIENEIFLLQQYILIYRYLSYKQIELILDINENDMKLQIPKDILQPLVENSIIHGLSFCNDKCITNGVIKIAIARHDGGIEIIVEDDGAGMDEETIQKSFFEPIEKEPAKEEDLPSIGISNIRRRLEYLYSDQFKIAVTSKLGEGTKICLVLPNNE